jgi:hypothetical protein
MSNDGDWKERVPLYQCTNQVRAARISRINLATGWLTLDLDTSPTAETIDMRPPEHVFSNGVGAAVGDYIVICDDGYVSWLPRHDFLSGYTQVLEY